MYIGNSQKIAGIHKIDKLVQNTWYGMIEYILKFIQKRNSIQQNIFDVRVYLVIVQKPLTHSILSSLKHG